MMRAAVVAAGLVLTGSGTGEAGERREEPVVHSLCQNSQWKQKRPGHADVEVSRLFACGEVKVVDSGGGGVKPVAPVPLPGAVVLFAAGLGCVVGMTQWRRKTVI